MPPQIAEVLSPTRAIKAALQAHPAFRFAVVVAGLAGVVALVLKYGPSPAALVFGCILLVVLMVLFLVFAQAAAAKKAHLELPATILVWSFLLLTILTAACLFTSAFFNGPLKLQAAVNKALGVETYNPSVPATTPLATPELGKPIAAPTPTQSPAQDITPAPAARTTSPPVRSSPPQQPAFTVKTKPLTPEPGQSVAPSAAAPSPPQQPTFPFKTQDLSAGTATIYLSPTIMIRMRLVNHNALPEARSFTPYYISVDRVPAKALRLYQEAHDDVMTQIPETMSDEDPLVGIWPSDARGITKMICARLPTDYQWVNAVVAGIISPQADTELVEVGDKEPYGDKELYTIRAGGPLNNPRFNTGNLRIGEGSWPEASALARGILPEKWYVRVVASRGKNFDLCK